MRLARHEAQAVAQHLQTLLNERESYRRQWVRLAGKTPPGLISQAAVARVIAEHLSQTGMPADHRLLKDKVYRALSGRVVTASTVGLFTAAFRFSDADKRGLWAQIAATPPAPPSVIDVARRNTRTAWYTGRLRKRRWRVKEIPLCHNRKAHR